MRKRDLHILTADVYTYSADERFRVLHPENSDDWTLHIKFTTERDAGVYECQVNSDPKISRKVTLTIKDSQLDDPLHYGIATTDTSEFTSVSLYLWYVSLCSHVYASLYLCTSGMCLSVVMYMLRCSSVPLLWIPFRCSILDDVAASLMMMQRP
nr:uncharacterized protein LOC128700220 [Cherax quadricarinatus]